MSFRTALFLGVDLAGAAALAILGFTRLGEAGSELTTEERGKSSTMNPGAKAEVYAQRLRHPKNRNGP